MKIIAMTHRGFFTQSMPDYMNVDVESIFSNLIQKGYECELLEYNDLAKFDYVIETDAVYWVGGHQNPTVNKYIKDVISARFYGCGKIIPNIETILSHENKGVMGIVASQKSLPFICQDYVCQNLIKISQNAAVFKKTTGAGSSGVSKIMKSKANKLKFYKNAFQTSTIEAFSNTLKNGIRKILGRREQAKYNELHSAHVIQEFVPNLDFDYKVLVFMDTVFCLKRSIRENDFRASGSGKFNFPKDISDELLDFAIEVRKQLDVPYCSLDIIEESDKNYSLIEFQTLHFGAYTKIKAPFGFKQVNKEFKRTQNSSTYEDLLCSSLHDFLEQR